MAVLRTECGSTTRTVDECAAIVPAATFHTRSGWARTCPIEAAVAPRADQVLLAESWLLRAIVLNI